MADSVSQFMEVTKKMLKPWLQYVSRVKTLSRKQNPEFTAIVTL